MHTTAFLFLRLAMVKTTYDLIRYIQSHKGISFKRKDEIAELALQDKTTIRE